MKKTPRLLALLLALVMSVQLVPLAAMGVFAEDEVTGTEETTQPAEGTTPTVTAMEWRDGNQAVALSPLADGMTLDSNYALIRLTLSDLPDSAEVKVDGIDMTSSIYAKKNQVLTYVEMINGLHRFDFTMHYGSEILVKTFFVNVEGSDPVYPEVKAESSSDILLGDTNELIITGTNMDAVSEVLVNISMTPSIKVSSIDIAKGYTGTYSWFRGSLTLNIQVYDETKITGDVLATVLFTTPAEMTPETELSWSVDSIESIPAEGSVLGNHENFSGIVYQPESDFSVSEGYTVEFENSLIVGNVSQTIIVKDSEGTPVAGVPVYGVDGDEDVLLGVTDEEGKITTDYFDGKGSYEIFVQDENGISSFPEDVFCYDSVGEGDGAPYAITLGTAVNNGRVFTWMSNMAFSAEVANVRLSVSADMTDAVIYSGESVVKYYHTTQAANRVNTVTVENLTPGEYYYQVGDGETWSEIKAFAVKPRSTTGTSFAITANPDQGNLALIAAAMANSDLKYDFAIQTSDIVTDTNDYDAWLNSLNVYAGFGDIDIIHTQVREGGNDAMNSAELFASYVYGDVFVSVINYTENEDDLTNALNNVIWDSFEGDYEWRLLIINRSPDAVDTEAADATAAKIVPSMIQRGNIDLVVSGDGNFYARSASLFNGEEAEINGVTYVVCGSDTKRDPINGDFLVTDSDYNALYLSITADKNSLTVTAYDVLSDGTVETVDSFTKIHETCKDGDHLYRSGVITAQLNCDKCGDKIPFSGYEGVILVLDQYMYRENGGFGRGWKTYNGRVYYFGLSTFLAVDGTVVIDGHTYVFENRVLVEGAWVNQDGVMKLRWAGRILRNTWHTQTGKTYYFFADGSYAVGTVDITTTDENGLTVTETYIFDENGVLIGKA